ncbi:MAG: hypothetical protein DWQ01_22105 [Planctomycetota bacterium]|nr:MAG: hypothetical protein DWQ01_22105 [Planctomycetota bacterium]
MLTTLVVFTLALAPQDPLLGQLPKQDLGVQSFLQQYPEYDGRGIRVAVLDTGVDPGHPLLQRTSTGGRKIVDWYDATTDGRVSTSVGAEVGEQGTVLGMSGRLLQLGKWAPPGSRVFLGRVDGEFLPGGLNSRIESSRRDAWKREKRLFEEERLRQQALGESEGAQEASAKANPYESFEDPGPVYDLVVFHTDGHGFRVLLDADEDGDLDEESALGSFRETGDWATLGDEALLNYAVGIEADGQHVTLFFDTNGHGTHVAGIVAANGGPGERLNGLAPGAEIVSIKIGDGKFGGATSGFSIAKALDFAVEAGCQVANISFGGPSFFADGREPDAWVLEEATRRGLIVVTSAGNDGPTLTTVGAPGTARTALAIAAAVWPDTQKVNYGSIDPSPPVLFDFSSRGPLPTGDLGIDFTAPGAAVSPLPSWLLTHAENFNGTSMASPQVAGAVALLLSSAKAEGLSHSPARVYRALRLGAKALPNAAWVEQGHGVVQLTPSLEALRGLAGRDQVEQAFEVRVRNPFGDGGGIYERALPSEESFERTVQVTPIFAKEATNAEKAAFHRSFRIHPESSWIQAPEAVYLSGQGGRFRVRLHPQKLGKGLHSSRILLVDADAPKGAGPDLVIPVTLLQAESVTAEQDFELRRRFKLKPGQLQRTFVEVPHGAGFAKVVLRHQGEGLNEYRTGAGSVSGFRYAEERQKRGRFFLSHEQTAEQQVPVEAGTVLEYTVASRWATNRPSTVELWIRFQGLEGQHEEWQVPAGQGMAYMALKSPLRRENLKVSASLEGVATAVTAPWNIVPDPIRATIFGGYGLFYGVREWPVDVEENATRITLRMPRSIQTTEIREDLMLEIFDRNGKAIQRTILYEIDTALDPLEKGSYTFRLSYPSLGTEPLQGQYAGCEMRRATSKQKLDLYFNLQDLMAAEHAGSSVQIPFAGVRTVFTKLPDLEPLPAGSYYYGSLQCKAGSNTLLHQEIRVERPELPTVAGVAVAASGEQAEDPVAEARGAFEKLRLQEDADEDEMVAKAEAWVEADSQCPEAELARLEALTSAGRWQEARSKGLSFLGRFPDRVEAFMKLAAQWNRQIHSH